MAQPQKSFTVCAFDQDGDLQIQVDLEPEYEMSEEMARIVGIRLCLPHVYEFADLHMGCGPPERWTFAVKTRKPFPWSQYVGEL